MALVHPSRARAVEIKPAPESPASPAEARPDAIAALAAYVARTRFEALPPAAVAVSRRQLLDTIGVALAGRNEDGARQLRQLGSELGGKGESAVWGSQLRLPAHDAARANAVMTHALEFDDTFGRGFLHPSVVTIPAALAVADQVGGVDGGELLAAITMGVDVACRLALSSQPGVDGFSTGWHNTTLVGYLASAMVAARLMRLDPQGIVNAAGIAAHQAAGNAQSHIDGALTKRLGPGFASAAGVLAARLASLGLSGPRGVLEGEKGWYRQYHHGHYSRELLLDGLGADFPALEMSFKPWPSCRGSHSSAEAALQLAAEKGFNPAKIDRILVRNGPAEWGFLSHPIERKRRPATTVEAQFSIPWVVAAALVDGKVSIAHFTPQALERVDIRAMADRIETAEDAGLANPHGGPGQAQVEVTDRDGRVLRKRVGTTKGDPDAPMTAAEIASKFADCAEYGRIPAERAEAIRQMVSRIEGVADVARLTDAMAIAG
jgi:2-methylcitrate dehydratase PrpD